MEAKRRWVNGGETEDELPSVFAPQVANRASKRDVRRRKVAQNSKGYRMVPATMSPTLDKILALFPV